MDDKGKNLPPITGTVGFKVGENLGGLETYVEGPDAAAARAAAQEAERAAFDHKAYAIAQLVTGVASEIVNIRKNHGDETTRAAIMALRKVLNAPFK